MAGFDIRGPVELRAIPHPAVTVAVEFGDRPIDIRGATGVMRSEGLVAGLGFHAFQARAEDLTCIQIRLSPLVAHPLLGIPLAELREHVVALDDLWGRGTARLRERLHQARTWRERFAVIGAELSGRLDEGREVEPEVAWVWRQIVASRGRPAVRDL
ncbi:AraC family transcriptional regulator, partial [Saccharopolyspora sp. WRP15-2]|nr:AraC family transcriptional regulator [Saccharopolyspora oryzae]